MGLAQTDNAYYQYPPLGDEDWGYVFQTAAIRALETHMLARSTLVDMASADSFASAVELLSGTDYAALTGAKDLGEVERVLQEKRVQLRRLLAEMRFDEDLQSLLAARYDFANLRLAVRRIVTERPVGRDYSDLGNVPAEELGAALEAEDYSRLPAHMRQGIEAAVLAYYAAKDIRQIDYALDAFEMAYSIERAEELGSTFLVSLFRLQVDLTNIRTMLRLKMADRLERDRFLPGGFLPAERFVHSLDLVYEAIAPLFASTPYDEVVEAGVSYWMAEQSFLRLERACDEYVLGYLRQTTQIGVGPQPVVAFFLAKEHEIRSVRLILTAKRNSLDTKLILDRVA
ncbi:MAG TPA: V-type ATPase subunit [Sedimentisphaerales bacterium]|nr:V-type ATPase subunit [Sedimentisphaerales bacterium]